jgi:tetratricopeptide (TPR) repeat protein
LNPKLGTALNNLAYLYSERFNRPDKAYELAQRARVLRPDDPNIADTLGWILYKQRNFPRALALISESAEKQPAVAEVQYHLGMAHYMMGTEPLAKAALGRALELNANFVGNVEANRCLAILNLSAKSGGGAAVATLEKAVAEHPDDSLALTRLGVIYEAQGQTEKAGSTLEAALKANPSNVPAAMSMVRVMLARKETGKAMDLAKATRKLAPEDPEVAHALGRLALAGGERLWALSLLQESARKKSDDPEVLFDWADAAYASGQIAVAENTLRDALKADPNFSRSAKAREILELDRLASNPAEAMAAAARIEHQAKAGPNDLPAQMALGALMEARNDLGGAKANYEAIVTVYPEFTPAMRKLTIVHAKAGEGGSKAIEYATKAREAYPSDAELAKAFGILMFKQGNFSRAQGLLLDSVRTLQTDAEAYYYLGMAQHNLKDRPASVRTLRRALELGLKGAQASEAQKVVGSATG